MEVKTVPDPTIEEPTDMIIRITATAICGSDLHLYHYGKPVMEEDYVVGHEPMGIVEEVGSAVTKVKKVDRVVIPFNIGCGECHFCTHHMESQCDNSNPNPIFDQGGLFGFGKMNGNHPGGQAPVIHLMPKIYDMIEKGEFDPSDIIAHTMPLERAAEAYDIFDRKADNNIKVVLKPGMS